MIERNMKENNIPFSSWQSIYKNSNVRNIAFFGSGNIAEKTYRRIDKDKLHSIYDNAPALWNTTSLNTKVKNPNELSNCSDEIYIIITSTSFREISEQLIDYGFSPVKDFSISPILNDLKVIDDLESIQKKLLFTSGSPSVKNEKYGGGVYELTIDEDIFNYKKIYDGNVYGLIKLDDDYIAVDIENGIVRLNKNFDIVSNTKLPEGARGHGIQYNKINQEYYICCSKRDSILILNRDLKIKDEIFLSSKFKKFGEPFHHCNDCYYENGYLYVSMFSISGNWKNDIFDGGIAEVDLNTKEISAIINNNLWMPHNIKKIDGGFTILDSLRGKLLSNNMQEIVKFSGFTRGLDHDGIFYYIGQSRNRNFSKNLGVSNNISIDAGIIIFDEISKVSRFLQLPPRLSEIHSITLI